MNERVQHLNEDGVYLFQRGNYAQARENFEMALSLKKDDPELNYNLGQCYHRLSASEKAEACYRKCLDTKPNHADSRHALARLLMSQGRRQDAEKTIHGWLASEPKLPDAYAEDAWLAHQDGDLQKAQARLQQALALDPHNTRALTRLGMIYEITERPDRALVLYEKALASDPANDFLRHKIRTLAAQGVKRPLLDG